MQLMLTPLSEAGVEVLPPDIVWLDGAGQPAGHGRFGFVGDFAMARTAAEGGAGGLQARNPLETAVLLLLFSDARVEDYELREEHRGDRRGWPGDGFDVDRAAGEAPLGSKLWLYRRAVLDEQTAIAVAAEARRALGPLVDQGVVARVDATASPDYANDRLSLEVALYARDGTRAYSRKFDQLWRRVDGGL